MELRYKLVCMYSRSNGSGGHSGVPANTFVIELFVLLALIVKYFIVILYC